MAPVIKRILTAIALVVALLIALAFYFLSEVSNAFYWFGGGCDFNCSQPDLGPYQWIAIAFSGVACWLAARLLLPLLHDRSEAEHTEGGAEPK